MTRNTGLDVRDRNVPGRPAKKRHWWRWILASVVALAALVMLAGAIALRLQASAPPLVLPGGPAAAPAGPVDGTWAARAGPVAGFRVRETALGISGDVTGQTDAVTGTIVISRGQVTRAVFRIDLASITVAGKTAPQVARSLDTTQYPTATITLARPVTLRPAFTSGATITVAATCRLTLRGTTQPVPVTLSARSAVPSRRAEIVTVTSRVIPRSVRRPVAVTVMVAPEASAGRSVTGRASTMVALGYSLASRLRANCG